MSALALSPHAVDGSYCGHRLASIDEYISTLTLRNPSEISLKKVITLSLSVMDMDSLVPLLFFLPHEWKEANLLDTLLQQHPDMENVLSGAFVKYFSPLTLAALADTTVGLSTDCSQVLICDMEEDRPDDISDSSIGGLVPPPNLGTRKSFTQTQLPDHEFESSPMFPMLYSGDNMKDPLLPSLPNPFVLSRDIPAIVNKILQVSGYREEGDADSDVKQPHVGSPVSEKAFPGLLWGYHGLKYKQTPRERAVYRVFAAVLNRLGGNCVPPNVRLEVVGPPHPPMDDSGSCSSSSMRMASNSSSLDNCGAVSPSAPITSSPIFSLCTALPENENENEPSSDRFSVMLHPTEKEGSESVEDLLKFLSKTHRIEFGTKAQATSFSKGLSFKEKGEIVYIPLAIPYKTGMPNIGDSTKQGPLLSYLPHCYFHVTLEGPLVNASVQAYEGVEGYNGWFAGDCLDIPWQNGDSVICQCNMPAYTKKEGLWAARLCNLNAVVHNLAGHRNKLTKGGYGSLSTCIDSTAVIDMGVKGSTMLYPILMSSDAKILLANTAEELATLSQCPINKKDFMKLRSVYLNIPSDIITQPQDIEVEFILLTIFITTLLSFQ